MAYTDVRVVAARARITEFFMRSQTFPKISLKYERSIPVYDCSDQPKIYPPIPVTIRPKLNSTKRTFELPIHPSNPGSLLTYSAPDYQGQRKGELPLKNP